MQTITKRQKASEEGVKFAKPSTVFTERKGKRSRQASAFSQVNKERKPATSVFQVRDPTLPQLKTKRKSVLSKGKIDPPPYRQHFQLYRLKAHQPKTQNTTNVAKYASSKRQIRNVEKRFQDVRDIPEETAEEKKAAATKDAVASDVLHHGNTENGELTGHAESMEHASFLAPVSDDDDVNNSSSKAVCPMQETDQSRNQLERNIHRRLSRMQEQAKKRKHRFAFEDVIQDPDIEAV